MPSDRTFQSRDRQFRVYRGNKAPRLNGVARYRDRPRSNIFRGLTVCIVPVAALLTLEVQALSVRCRDIPAARTATACVTGTDRFRLNTDSRRLVGDFESHIGVRPSVDFGTEVFPLTQRTVSYVREFFYHDLSCAEFNRVADQCLRGGVQEHSGYGGLVPRHPSQEPPGILGANRLDSRTNASDARTTVIQFTPMEEKCFSVGRVGRHQHALDAHIHPDNATFGLQFWNFNLITEAQIPLFADPLELGILPRSIRERSAVLDCEKLTPERDALLGAVEIPMPHNGHYGAVESRQSPTLGCLGRVVGSAHGLAQRTSQLRRKAHLAEVGVVGFGKPIGIKLLSFEGNFRQPVCGLQPNDEETISFCAAGNLELDCADCFHYIEDYCQEKTMSTELRRNNHSVSRLLVHLVFVVKYRHAVISDSVWTSLRYGFDLSAKRLDLVLVELNHDKDHVHLVVEYPPKVSISEMANAL